MRIQKALLLGTSLLLSMSLLLAATASAFAPLPRTWNGGQLKVRPASITYTGDGSAFFAGSAIRRCRTGRCATSLKWTSYDATSATATGADWIDDCTPDCARGTFHAIRTTLKLFRPRRVHGQLVFTRMRFSDKSAKPQTISLSYAGSSFTW